jgi:Ca2+-binding EF-hand superfamily protein
MRLILTKLDDVISEEQVKSLMSEFMAEDHNDVGYIQERMFRSIARGYIGLELSEHEIITLTRAYRTEDMRHARLPEETLLALLQNELREGEIH